jgi:DNA-binding FadR family transcriptional regulator
LASTSKFDLINYLSCVSRDTEQAVNGEIPALKDISESHGISIAKLREQLSVARSLGFVDVQPRTGIRLLPYSFSPAVRQSLSYALSLDRAYFADFSDLRRHIEANYWFEAVEKLGADDLERLDQLVRAAQVKLDSTPPRLPHQEHRDFHLTIFGRLENVFVVGLLEAYWDAYEAVGLSQFTELTYLKDVWRYHRLIVDALRRKEYDEGYQLLLEHMDLIKRIPGSRK